MVLVMVYSMYMRYIILKRLSILVFLVFILNTAGSFFGWYSLLPWYDNLMHFLGGAWLSLVATWFFYHKIQRGSINLGIVLLFVLVGALMWEFLEYFIQYMTQAPNALATMPDSISDVIFGLLGGLVLGYQTIGFIRR